MSAFPKTKRNHVLRMPKRGQYEREEVYAIVDAGLVCHVAFVMDGQPLMIPTLHARDGDTLLLHGSSASRMIRHIAAGHPICATVTLLDGIVLARSIFNHSINYRSAVLFGSGALITDDDAKLDALARFSERILPGRWDDARLPNAQELKATGIVAIPIASASAKVRAGAPIDEPEDLDLPVWGGVIPIHQMYGTPVADAFVPEGMAVPAYLQAHLSAGDAAR